MRAAPLIGPLLALTLALAPAPVRAADAASPEFRQSVLELMRLTGAGEMGAQVADAVFRSVVEGLRRANPDLPHRAVTITNEVATEVFAKAFSDEQQLLDAYAPIYARHFSQEEVEGLIAFYRTPLGRKAASVMPAVAQESMVVGQQWASQLEPSFSAELQRRLQAEDLAPAAP